MENNLYYTPTIEEFHVGFEFETNNVSTLPKEKQIWKQMIATPDIVGAIDYDLSTNSREGTYRNESIRVKYLDREDIESLGWEHVGSLWFEKDDYKLRKWKEQSLDIYYIYPDGEKIMLFRGTIKNKSELIKLMQQLNIK